MPTIPTKAELKKVIEQVKALHNRMPKRTPAREFILHALCSLEGAVPHLPEAVSRTGKEQRRTRT